MINGARVIKTGIAVALSMFICDILHVHPAIFAGATAVLTIQPSLGKSFNKALELVLTQLIAITLAITLGMTIGGNPLVMGLSTILVILICNRLKLRGSITGGIVATIFVLDSPPDQFLDQAIIRSIVIFIGVVSGLFVNITLAPPHYEVQLGLKLIELNKFIFRNFKQVIENYVQLTPPKPHALTALEKEIGRLFKEVHDYYGLYKHDLGITKDNNNKIDQRKVIAQLYNDYLTYNKGLWQRTKDIFFLAEERTKRRKKAGDQPTSEDFQQILHLIDSSLELFSQYNRVLQEKIAGKATMHVEEPHIWSKLDKIINQWHSHNYEGSYHLHALIEVSLITHKIRWAAKESAHLLKQDLNDSADSHIE